MLAPPPGALDALPRRLGHDQERGMLYGRRGLSREYVQATSQFL
jgi:hypothetical protein